MTTGFMVEKEGELEQMDNDLLLNCRGKKLIMAVYAQA
jgi:hypothetical protein